MDYSVTFPSGTVKYMFGSAFDELWQQCDPQHTIIVTNEHLAKLYRHFFKDRKVLVVPPAESSKDILTIERLARELIQMEATRKTMIVGVGGGVVTDITGFLASVYMRGVPFGFVPTTLLGMVDAAVGGKNGVNLGMNKNMLGTINQPDFILYDTRFLDTLPDDEWSNGFAEVIKYACLYDEAMYQELESHNISYYKNEDDAALGRLIEKCVQMKNKAVSADEKDKGSRMLLNFGHTAAHAIENMYDLPHGKAVGIGMVIACMISEHVAGLKGTVTESLKSLLAKYHLPVSIRINAKKVMEILRMDKKRADDKIDYIVLSGIGSPEIKELPLSVIAEALEAYESNN